MFNYILCNLIYLVLKTQGRKRKNLPHNWKTNTPEQNKFSYFRTFFYLRVNMFKDLVT